MNPDPTEQFFCDLFYRAGYRAGELMFRAATVLPRAGVPAGRFWHADPEWKRGYAAAVARYRAVSSKLGPYL